MGEFGTRSHISHVIAHPQHNQRRGGWRMPAFARSFGILLLPTTQFKNLTRHCRPEAASRIVIWPASERSSSWVYWGCTWKGESLPPQGSQGCPFSTSAARSAFPSLLRRKSCRESGKMSLHLTGRWSRLCTARFKTAAGFSAKGILRGNSSLVPKCWPPHALFPVLVSVFCPASTLVMYPKLSPPRLLMPWAPSRVSCAFSRS
jgi:hypothetical protein